MTAFVAPDIVLRLEGLLVATFMVGAAWGWFLFWVISRAAHRRAKVSS